MKYNVMWVKKMKYIRMNLYLILLGSFLLFQGNVNAETCKPSALNEIYYAQGDYADVLYCSGTSTLATSGCMPTSYAMVVANLSDSSVTPVTIRDEICNSDTLKSKIRGELVASYFLGTSADAKAVADKYNISITKYASSGSEVNLEELKSKLQSGSMFLVSMKCTSSDCPIKTSSAGHYVVLSNVNDAGEIVILNPGNRSSGKASYSDSQITSGIVNHLNQGIWEAVNPTAECTSTNTSTNTDTDTNKNADTDHHENILPSLNTEKEVKCEKIFKDGDDFNEFGEFLQDVFFAIKVLAPALVIILSTIDYIKAIASSNQDEVKKATQRTIKRLIIGIFVFLLPFLLDLLFELFGIYDLSTCGIGS